MIAIGCARKASLRRWAIRLFALVAVLFTTRGASAQQKTFYLDRLTIGGAPEDGIALWRPTASQQPRLFAQLALGFTLNPLRMRTIAVNESRLRQAGGAAVSTQFMDYMTVGIEGGERAQFLLTLPVALYESGSEATTVGVTGTGDLSATSVHDLRMDFRGIFWRSDDRKSSLGAALSVYLATGDRYTFAGDGAAHTALSLSGETQVRPVTLTFNTGIHWRPTGVMGNLAVGNEWTFAAGVFYPLREGKVRVGGEIFGSTGIESLSTQNAADKSTFFRGENTPLELLLEGRMTLPDQPLWIGGGLGTHLDLGYGAPDVRVIAMAGYHHSIDTSEAKSPSARLRGRVHVEHELVDTDKDGLPDDIDLCPTEPEDHQPPDPSDGCPKAADRDNDGIPDQFDKCPDLPEDKDGFEDSDGCPDPDNDNDGIPDVQDACPREPGVASPDPQKNGCPQFVKRVQGSTEISILKRIEFDTGKASIKASSYPILDEIVLLLKANPEIKRMAIEGHTDDRGAVEMNKRLSQGRADSVLSYLASHGIAAGRLEAHGYGPSRPIESNQTADGRQKNRRVEFHILDQSTSP